MDTLWLTNEPIKHRMKVRHQVIIIVALHRHLVYILNWRHFPGCDQNHHQEPEGCEVEVIGKPRTELRRLHLSRSSLKGRGCGGSPVVSEMFNWWAWDIRQGGFTTENGGMATEMFGYYITGIYLDCSGLLIAFSENQWWQARMYGKSCINGEFSLPCLITGG